MRNDDFNIWEDLLGYTDMDYDGDVDWIDADLEDDIFNEFEKSRNDSSFFDGDYDDLDDFDNDF